MATGKKGKGEAKPEARSATKKPAATQQRLEATVVARGQVNEKQKAPNAPRKAPEARTPRAAKPVEEVLPLMALVKREVAQEVEGVSRFGQKLGNEKGAAASREEIKSAPRKNAQELAQKQREISVAEFFAKNRHLLGFDSPAKSLLMAIKEAVDNALDACEEAGILPTIAVSIKETGEDRYRIAVEDNGPGIIKQQIPKIFGKLLYGSKFNKWAQSRGAQGLGISAAVMYGQLTTGKPAVIVSRAGEDAPATYCELTLDTRTNKPEVHKEKSSFEFRAGSGTRVEIEMSGVYKRGRHSIDAYLQQTSISNPHAEISYLAPKETEWTIFRRQAKQLPKEPIPMKPHPHGIEYGLFLQMLRDTQQKSLQDFLLEDFSRVNERIVGEIASASKIAATTAPHKIQMHLIEGLYNIIQGVKIPAPATHCLSPIGEELLRRGLEAGVEGAEFYTAITRPPAVYRGNPFQVEVGIAFGGKLPADDPCDLYRFANRVPLLYQQSACAISKSVMGVDWKAYGLSHPKGAMPVGPVILVVHIASTWVPFTSESKEAIAHYPEIMREIRLAVQECGRLLGAHVRRLKKYSTENKKRSYIDKYIPHIGEALQQILGLPTQEKTKIVETLRDTLERGRREMLPAAMRKAEDAEELAERLKTSVETVAEKTKASLAATITNGESHSSKGNGEQREKSSGIAKQTLEVLTLEPTVPKRKRSKT